MNDEITPHSAPSAASHSIENIAHQYSDHLSAGGDADLTKWLQQVPASHRDALRTRLSTIHDTWRSSPTQRRSTLADQTTSIQDFRKLDMHHALDTSPDANLLRDPSADHVSGIEATQLDHSAHEAAPKAAQGHDSTELHAGPASGMHLPGYQIEEELGRGGMGIVYRAVRLATGEQVALKILPSVNPDALYRFKSEFKSLESIHHCNLVTLQTLEASERQVFLTMDLVEDGIDFLEYVRPNDILDVQRLRHSLRQLAEGIMAVHQHGRLHRDLKPSNVLINPEGKLSILDFGLVAHLNPTNMSMTNASVSGTPIYMAPETAASEPEGPASDWYAIGVMTYAALAGRVPFDGSIWEILRDKQTKQAPPIANQEQLPAELVALTMKLLAREPAARPSPQETLEALGTPAVDAAVAPAASEPAEIPLVGREQQLSELKRCFEETSAARAPRVVFVSGKSGEGKSSLIDTFLADVRQRSDTVVLWGRCYDRENVPFKALDSLMDALASWMRTLQPVEVLELLPDNIGFLSQLFPVLKRVEHIAKRPPPEEGILDQRQTRTRAFGALRELLRRATMSRRMLLVCDDLQWGDESSAVALEHLLGGENPPNILFIGSYRSDERDTSAFLQSLEATDDARIGKAPICNVTVGPLTIEQCRLLVSQRTSLGRDETNRLTNAVFEECGGNAFFLTELIDGLNPDSRAISRVPLSELTKQKLSRLPTSAQAILEFIAISGKAMALGDLKQVANTSEFSLSLLTRMRNERLVRLTGASDTSLVDTYHDKIRETTLHTMDPRRQREIHEEFAKFFEPECLVDGEQTLTALGNPSNRFVQSSARVFDWAMHLRSVGDSDKAVLATFLAAKQALSQNSTELARELLSICYEAISSGRLASYGIEICHDYAYVLTTQGDYEHAAKVALFGSKLPGSAIQRARVLQHACQSVYFCGRPMESIQLGSEALKLCGVRVPIKKWQSYVAGLRYVAQDWLTSKRKKAPNDDEYLRRLVICRILIAMGWPTAFHRGDLFWWMSACGVFQSSYCPGTVEQVSLRSNFAMLISMMGFQKQGTRLAGKVDQLLEKFDDGVLTGFSMGQLAIARVTQGRFEESIELNKRAMKAFDEVGEKWRNNLYVFHLAFAYFKTGKLDAAITTAFELAHRAVEEKDIRSNCAFYLLARITDGKLDIDYWRDLIPRNDDDRVSTCNLDKGLSICFRQRGDFPAALEWGIRSWARAIEAHLGNLHAVASLPVLAETQLRHARLARSERHPDATKLARQAYRTARKAAWLCRFVPVEYPFALRQYALSAADLGKKKKALRLLEKSRRVAKQQSAEYDLALAEWEAAQLGGATEGHQASELTARLDRFEALIEEGLRSAIPSVSR